MLTAAAAAAAAAALPALLVFQSAKQFKIDTERKLGEVAWLSCVLEVAGLLACWCCRWRGMLESDNVCASAGAGLAER